MDLQNKILGILGAAAIGDAMGAATENKSFEQIRAYFKGEVKEFYKPEQGAFALGNDAGQVTDDFSQIYLICQNILKNDGLISTEIIIKTIIEWSNYPEYFNRFAGPTTRSAIEMYKSGSKEIKPLPGAVAIDYASKATNGAAMKIAPAAIINPGNIESSINDAIIITKVTHNNSLAISGACAVSAATSAALAKDSTWDEMISAGIYGAIRGETLGKKYSIDVAGASVVKRIELAYNIVNSFGNKHDKLKQLSSVVGSGLHVSEAVPCAFGIIMLNPDKPINALIDAVNIGYDTDTIACIVGTMIGAFIDISDLNFQKLLDIVEKVNHFDIKSLARNLDAMVKLNAGKNI